MLLLYSRVSSAEQAADDKTSLENQERIGRGFAMAKGYNQFDVSVYTDAGVSASIPLSKRPSGWRMLTDAKKDDTIFAAKLDRMFRSASDALNMVQILQERGIKLVLFDLGSEPIADSALGQFFFTIVAAVAQLERTMIKERCTNGKKAKIAKGGHAGGLAPYGFRIVGKGRDARREIDPEENRVLEKVKSWVDERGYMSPCVVIQLLEQEGMKPRNGKPWHPMQAARLVERVQCAGQ